MSFGVFLFLNEFRSGMQIFEKNSKTKKKTINRVHSYLPTRQIYILKDTIENINIMSVHINRMTISKRKFEQFFPTVICTFVWINL